MNYYLNRFPFGPMQSRDMLHDGERFDEKNFPEEVTDVATLLESLKKHSMAIQVCEDQLMPFLRRDPFIPDYFGFKQETVQIIDDNGDAVDHIAYISLEHSRALIPDYANPGSWTLRNLYGEKVVDLFIPNAMIGYFVMASLGFASFELNEKAEVSDPADTDHTA